MKKLGLILTAFILMAASAAVFAQLKPPSELVRFIGQLPIVYDKKCNVPSQKLENVECLIMAADKDSLFIVLFADDQQTITQIIFVDRQGEKVLWSGAI